MLTSPKEMLPFQMLLGAKAYCSLGFDYLTATGSMTINSFLHILG